MIADSDQKRTIISLSIRGIAVFDAELIDSVNFFLKRMKIISRLKTNQKALSEQNQAFFADERKTTE